MNVDKFGSYVLLREKNNDFNLHECVLKYTNDGNIDLQNKIIQNVGTPTSTSDCATKNYVDGAIETCRKVLKTLDKIIADLIDKVNKLEKHCAEVIKIKTKK